MTAGATITGLLRAGRAATLLRNELLTKRAARTGYSSISDTFADSDERGSRRAPTGVWQARRSKGFVPPTGVWQTRTRALASHVGVRYQER